VFSYTFSNTNKSIPFYVGSTTIVSENYVLEVIKTPTIRNISVALKYPKYTGKKNETIHNSGVLLIPEGTSTTWNVTTNQTEKVTFLEDSIATEFNKVDGTLFSLKKTIKASIEYQIATSNSELKNYEKLFFKIAVIKDEFPKIEVLSDIDSLSNNTAQFAGKISDDYGLTALEIIYYNEDSPNQVAKKQLEISSKENQTFYIAFPGELEIEKGINYELYFQVSDNDGINGRKKSKSKKFNFRNKSDTEVEQEAILEQRNQLKAIEKTLQKREDQKKDLEEIKESLQNKKNVNWNDQKKIEDYIKRQEQYKKMMQRQTDKLHENIKELPKDSKSILQKKEALKKQIAALKKLEKEQKLLDELKELAKKLNKEDLLRKVKKLAEQNKQQERSLERVLELTKRFYVEQKTMQIANKLEELSKKQDSVRNSENSKKEPQENIKKEFNKIQKEIDELQKDNKALKEPMQIPDTKEAEKEVNEQLEKAAQNNTEQKNEQQDKNSQKKNQQKAAQKMQEISQKLQKAMSEMEGEMKEVNEKSLRIILENLLNYSFKQEDLMNRFSKISVTDPNFGKEIKNQNTLKTYFEHIDDSLYVLSMRLPEISVKIQKDLTDAHYNINQSLENFTEDRFSNGQSNQQYVMTAVNNLADFLSDILDNMQQPKMSTSGKGKKGGKPFSLPDIIQKQEDLVKKMQKGTKKGEKGKEGESKKGEGDKGEKKGESKGNSQPGDLDGELYQIYQEQSLLRQELENALKEGKASGNTEAKKVLKTLEQLESEILEKGFNAATIQKMQQLKYTLLKLDKAAFKQDKDTKRKSTTNQQAYTAKEGELFIKKLFYNQTEILNRQSLPLQKDYKKKVYEYFKQK
jgi:hypothetical protein